MPVAATSPEAPREFDLVPSDNARLANLSGPLDENLRLLEARLEVRIQRRGGTFRVSGARGGARRSCCASCTRRTHRGCDSGAGAPGAARRESGPAATEAGTAGRARAARRHPARGAHQRDYLQHIRTRDLTFGIGPAGTGKTYLAVACAVGRCEADRVRRLVLVRPAVGAGERLGFLPGTSRRRSTRICGRCTTRSTR
jgi:phosphate starvation-inducible PhoH-like protein